MYKNFTPEILNTIKHLLQIFRLVYNICEFTTQNQKVFKLPKTSL